MRIQFPNPDDYCNDVMGFLEQMELCIHHAKKSAQKILSKYTPEDLEVGNDTPYPMFKLGELDTNHELRDAVDKSDPDLEIRKDISLEIIEM